MPKKKKKTNEKSVPKQKILVGVSFVPAGKKTEVNFEAGSLFGEGDLPKSLENILRKRGNIKDV